jgi:hypothetical protein
MGSKIKPFVVYHSSQYIYLTSTSVPSTCSYRVEYRRDSDNIARLINANGCPNPALKIHLDQVATGTIPVSVGGHFWVCCEHVTKYTWKVAALILGGVALVAVALAIWQWLR